MIYKDSQTINKQIDRLENVHKLIINDKKRATNILSTMNYCLIRGYGHQFIIDPHDKVYKFKPNTSIEQIYDLFIFDNDLRSALLTIIGITEKSLRTVISNTVSCKRKDCKIEQYDFYPNFGAFDNLYEINNIISSNISRLKNLYLNDLEKQKIDANYKIKSNPVIFHYFHNHNGKFPLWIILEFVSFGDLSKIYRYMISDDKAGVESDRITVAKIFNTSPNRLSRYIKSIKDLRNKCCHFNRIYGIRNLIIPPYISNNLTYEQNKFWSSHTLFSILLVLKFLNKNNKVDWVNFVNLLKDVINKHSNVSLDVLGFPNDWENQLLN